MTLRVSGKNLAIGDALRSHVHSRVDSLVAKYQAGAATGHVTIEPEGSGYRADCTLFLKGGVTLQVEALAQEPYASFDKATDRIERRLRDHRKRVLERHGMHANGPADTRGSDMRDADIGDTDIGDTDMGDAPTPLDAMDGEAEGRADDQADGGVPTDAAFPAVVAEPAANFREMTVAAAVRALDETDHPVVVFRYAENSRINIVYRRPDGNIGWIDPLGIAGARGS